MRRGRRKESRLETGTSGVGAGRTCPVSPRISIPRCEAGSIITGASTAQSCIPLQSVSTGTSFDGRCTSSNDCGTGPTGRGPGYTVSVGESLGCSLTGTSSHAPPAGLWGPDDERSSRPVLRAAGGVIPPPTQPGRKPHDALDALAVGIERRRVSWVLDADIRDFFTKLDQAWLMKFIEHRIADRRVLRLIDKWLAAGV